MILLLVLACTVGDSSPATPGSASAEAAAAVREIAVDAGAIANAAREIEQMSDPARSRVASGANPDHEIAKMRAKMAEIDAIHTELRAKLVAVEAQLATAAAAGVHSSAETAE
jgi:hypothetical protein